MKNDRLIETSEELNVPESELNKVIGANKELYDKLNEIPEIEALDSILEEEEEKKVNEKESRFAFDLIKRVKSFYNDNELVKNMLVGHLFLFLFQHQLSLFLNMICFIMIWLEMWKAVLLLVIINQIGWIHFFIRFGGQ